MSLDACSKKSFTSQIFYLFLSCSLLSIFLIPSLCWRTQLRSEVAGVSLVPASPLYWGPKTPTPHFLRHLLVFSWVQTWLFVHIIWGWSGRLKWISISYMQLSNVDVRTYFGFVYWFYRRVHRHVAHKCLKINNVIVTLYTIFNRDISKRGQKTDGDNSPAVFISSDHGCWTNSMDTLGFPG